MNRISKSCIWLLTITSTILVLYGVNRLVYHHNRRKHLRLIAVTTLKLFNKYNIDYWIDFGTLLGVIRDNDIIYKDNDVDIVIVDSKDNHEKMKLVKRAIEKLGFKLVKETWSAYRVKKYGLFADIYINQKDYKEKVFIGSIGVNSNIPFDLVGTPKTIVWRRYNLDVKVPEHIHSTLLWRYGPDYMTPRQGFKGRSSS